MSGSSTGNPLTFTPHMVSDNAGESESHRPPLPYELPILSHPLTVSDVDPATLNSEHSRLCQFYSCMFCDHVSAGEMSISLHVAEVHKCRSLFFCTECDYQCSVKELLTIHVTTHLWVSCEVAASHNVHKDLTQEVIVKQEGPDETDTAHYTTETDSHKLELPSEKVKARKNSNRSRIVDRKRKRTCAFENWPSYQSEILHVENPSLDIGSLTLDSENWLKDHYPKKPKLKFKTFSALMKTLKRWPNVIMDIPQHSFADCDRFTCYICGFVTKKFAYFKDHFMLHFDLTPFVCKHCGAGFVSQPRLQKHVKSVHAQDRQFLCQACPYTAKTNECLRKHMRLQHPQDEDLKYECPDCHMKFASLLRLQNHQHLTHKLSRKFVCDMCNFSSSIFNTMKTHTNRHLGITYLCSICGREYFSKYHMKRHQQRHSMEAVFQCDRCPFSTNQQESLKSHSKVHSNERPFKCSLCNHTAKTSTAIRAHMKSHMSVRKFSCIECGKSFKFKHHLERHHEQHANMELACPLCDYRGQSTAAYQRHMLLHDASRRQNCPMCERYFATRGELLTHVKKVHAAPEAYAASATEVDSAKWEDHRLENRHL